MSSSVTLTLSLLLSIVLAASFNWDRLGALPMSHPISRTSTHVTADGTIHIFAEYKGDPGYMLSYDVFYPTKTLVHKKSIKGGNYLSRFLSISGDVSNDGKHIVVAYSTHIHDYNCFEHSSVPCSKINFIESLNGGTDWTEPIEVVYDDNKHNIMPSVHLEKDTGRVLIAYGMHEFNDRGISTLVLATREPKEKTFTSKVIGTPINDMSSITLVHTTIRTTSKEYLHLLVRDALEFDIGHSRSEDSGKTWSEFKAFVEDSAEQAIMQVTANSEVDEGGIYIQTNKNKRAMISSSRDHGNTLESPQQLDGVSTLSSKIVICGSSGTGIILSAYYDQSQAQPYTSFAPLNGKFASLPYAFKGITGPLEIVGASCAYGGKDKYGIMLLVKNLYVNYIYIAQGVLDLK